MNYYIITGSSRGLGKAFTEELLKNSNNFVVGISRTLPDIVSKRYIHLSIDLFTIDEQKINNIFEKINMENVKKIVLINNAGVVDPIDHLEEISNSKLVEISNINYVIPTILTKEFFKTYKDLPVEKVVLNITSGAAELMLPSLTMYCSTKSALNRITMCLAKEQENKKYPVKVVAVSPGMIETSIQKVLRDSEFEGKEFYISAKEKEQVKNVNDVAKTILNNLHTLKEGSVINIDDISK